MKPVLIAFFIVLLAACKEPTITLENEKEIIVKSWIDWGKKADAGDPGYYWADDMVIMGPGGPMIRGKSDFLKMFSGMAKNPGFKLAWDREPSEIIVSKDGQMAYLFAQNKVTITDSTGAVTSGINQALQVWKKDKNGNWKAAVSVMYPISK